MNKLVQAGVIAVAGIGVWMAIGGRIESQAADEIRCRVNAEALIKDIAALRSVDANTLDQLLKADRDALERATKAKP